ncbi:MAG TPA: hypothetical protein VHP36_00310 [Chitinispirillaceae bacterium]|nr:hypothetical protein [Chitinispirillaceae bacterium]
MSIVKWRNFIGQERIKSVLESALQTNTIGHAYLFCGAWGTGKFAGAVELAMTLLCSASENRPCYECDSCRKIIHFAHPCLHILMPMVFEKEHKSGDGLTEAGWDLLSTSIRQRIADPYKQQIFSGLPSIPLEWVREVNHAVLRGAVDNGRNIVIIDGIDSLQKGAANAMLKTLEEPPSGTLMLLLTERIHAVLPTIVSRCQILRFAYLAPELLHSQLVKRFSLQPDDPRLDELVCTGSLGQSLYLLENSDQQLIKNASEFWKLCTGQNWLALSEMIDMICVLNNDSTYEKLFVHMIRLLRNAFLKNIEGTENYIMGDRSFTVELNRVSSPDQLESLVELCEKAIKHIRARVNISLILVNFAIAAMEILNGQK